MTSDIRTAAAKLSADVAQAMATCHEAVDALHRTHSPVEIGLMIKALTSGDAAKIRKLPDVILKLAAMIGGLWIVNDAAEAVTNTEENEGKA